MNSLLRVIVHIQNLTQTKMSIKTLKVTNCTLNAFHPMMALGV